jgi:hypothetical protein
MDDSGTRTLDREPTPFEPSRPNHFALGGILVFEEDEEAIRSAHEELCARWDITYPLHSVDIRHGTENFSWVRRDSDEYKPFMRDLTRMLTAIPVTALACVMDRPGYDRRYRSIYPRSMWHLCRTVFSIAVERAAKYARALGRPLRVFPEKSARDDERRIRQYYASLLTEGPPFNSATSKLYAPLAAHEFKETLIELRFKAKSSPPMQIADLYLWPIAMYRYNRGGQPHERFQKSGRLIEAHLTEQEIPARGTKYSCFELVDAAAKNNKGPKDHSEPLKRPHCGDLWDCARGEY